VNDWLQTPGRTFGRASHSPTGGSVGREPVSLQSKSNPVTGQPRFFTMM